MAITNSFCKLTLQRTDAADNVENSEAYLRHIGDAIVQFAANHLETETSEAIQKTAWPSIISREERSRFVEKLLKDSVSEAICNFLVTSPTGLQLIGGNLLSPESQEKLVEIVEAILDDDDQDFEELRLDELKSSQVLRVHARFLGAWGRYLCSDPIVESSVVIEESIFKSKYSVSVSLRGEGTAYYKFNFEIMLKPPPATSLRDITVVRVADEILTADRNININHVKEFLRKEIPHTLIPEIEREFSQLRQKIHSYNAFRLNV